MKHFITLLIVLYFSSIAQAQTYNPFPDSVAVWVEEFYQGVFDQTSWYSAESRQCDIYVMEGDTLMLDSSRWNKIYLYNTLNDVVPESYFGALKEDSAKQVWLWMATDTVPFIIYNFALQLGDTFNLSIPGKISLAAEVIYRDTVTGYMQLSFDTMIQPPFFDEDSAIQLFISGSGMSWTPGKGSSNGLVYFYSYTSGRTGLIYKQTRYFNDTSTAFPAMSCNDYVSVAEVENNAQINVFPVPATHEVVIISTVPFNYIALYNINGEIIEKYETPKAVSYTLDVNTLLPGMYVIQMNCNGDVEYKRFIKQ